MWYTLTNAVSVCGIPEPEDGNRPNKKPCNHLLCVLSVVFRVVCNRKAILPSGSSFYAWVVSLCIFVISAERYGECFKLLRLEFVIYYCGISASVRIFDLFFIYLNSFHKSSKIEKYTLRILLRRVLLFRYYSVFFFSLSAVKCCADHSTATYKQ